MSSIDIMQRELAVFSYGQKQDLLTLLTVLDQHGWSTDDFKVFMAELKPMSATQGKFGDKDFEKIKQYSDRMQQWVDDGKKCPVCSSVMWIHEVNTGPGNQVGEGLRSQLLCSNKDCLYAEYKEKDPDEILKEYGIGD